MGIAYWSLVRIANCLHCSSLLDMQASVTQETGSLNQGSTGLLPNYSVSYWNRQDSPSKPTDPSLNTPPPLHSQTYVLIAKK